MGRGSILWSWSLMVIAQGHEAVYTCGMSAHRTGRHSRIKQASKLGNDNLYFLLQGRDLLNQPSLFRLHNLQAVVEARHLLPRAAESHER